MNTAPFDFISQEDRVTIYTKDRRCRGLSVNETVVRSFGLNSADDYVGMTDYDLPYQNDFAAAWIENDKRVMARQKPEMIFELCNCAGTLQWFRSFKSPLFGRMGNVIGVTGFSLKISDQAMIPLTPRELACLKEYARGFTYDQIAHSLGLSKKTVDNYIERIKNKLSCNTRNQLLIQAFERGLIGFF